MPIVNHKGKRIRFPYTMGMEEIEQALAAQVEPVEEPAPDYMPAVLDQLARLCAAVEAQNAAREAECELIEQCREEEASRHERIMAALNREPEKPEPEPQPGYLFEVERDEDGRLQNIIAIPQE